MADFKIGSIEFHIDSFSNTDVYPRRPETHIFASKNFTPKFDHQCGSDLPDTSKMIIDLGAYFQFIGKKFIIEGLEMRAELKSETVQDLFNVERAALSKKFLLECGLTHANYRKRVDQLFGRLVAKFPRSMVRSMLNTYCFKVAYHVNYRVAMGVAKGPNFEERFELIYPIKGYWNVSHVVTCDEDGRREGFNRHVLDNGLYLNGPSSPKIEKMKPTDTQKKIEKRYKIFRKVYEKNHEEKEALDILKKKFKEKD